MAVKLAFRHQRAIFGFVVLRLLILFSTAVLWGYYEKIVSNYQWLAKAGLALVDVIAIGLALTFIASTVIEQTPAEAMDVSLSQKREEHKPPKPSPLPANVLPFAAKPKPPARGRRKKTGSQAMRVDYVKVSKNTWAFRIRWREGEQEPAVYVSRVDDKRFKSITKGKVRYAAFKKQLISSFLSRTVRQGHGIDASPNRAV